MSSSANSFLAYGFKFNEDYVFPWTEDGLENWWKKENNFVPIFEPFNARGNFNPGYSYSDPRLEQYCKHKKEWEEMNPIPIKIVKCGSYEYYTPVLTLPNLCIKSDWEEPLEIEISDLEIDSENKKYLMDFCSKYNLAPNNPEPTWWLCSYLES